LFKNKNKNTTVPQ